MTSSRLTAPLLLLALGIVALALFAMTIGAYRLDLADILAVVLGQAVSDSQAGIVIWSIRLPRVLGALALGACLAAAGAVYQQIFRNPLVSPDILGVSAGAGLGAVIGIFLSLPVIGIQMLAFVGGLAAVGAVMGLAAGIRRQDTVLVLVLAGVVIGALAGSATSLLKVLADPYDQLPAITFWLLGSLAATAGSDIMAALPFAMVALVPLVLLRHKVDVLAMGDEEARALGVDTGRIRIILIVAATLITASVVSFAGVVGWVGLIIPHFARMLVGPSFHRLLPTAILIGAGFMLIVDTIARTIAVKEVPLGILTAVIGAPVFVYLLARGRRAWS
ncbi:iron ABC transporter permease [Rhizobium albus]|nr:iron ABC transporter permease [Rhizobium albus]